jgi:hypothetical protein
MNLYDGKTVHLEVCSDRRRSPEAVPADANEPAGLHLLQRSIIVAIVRVLVQSGGSAVPRE